MIRAPIAGLGYDVASVLLLALSPLVATKGLMSR
jgi:hypothetical protein